MAYAPMWKLRRLAPRARRVYERRKGEGRMLLAYGASLVPAADAFMAAYDQAGRYLVIWRKEMDEGTSAIGELITVMRGWLPLLKRDIVGFDASGFGNSRVPDDVIEDGEQLLGMVEDYVDNDGNSLPYQSDVVEDLDRALAAAQKESSEAEAADSKYQKLLADTRTTAAAFDSELQAFRRSLAAVVGRRDKDFQKLRTQRAASRDEDDDPNAPPPAEPVASAEPDQQSPAAKSLQLA